MDRIVEEKTKGRAREHRVWVRLDDREYSNLLADVGKSGLSREGYLRTLILDKRPVATKDQMKTIHEAKNELRRIGNNLNQLARIAHSKGWIRPERYDEAVEQLNAAYEKLGRWK